MDILNDVNHLTFWLSSQNRVPAAGHTILMAGINEFHSMNTVRWSDSGHVCTGDAACIYAVEKII